MGPVSVEPRLECALTAQASTYAGGRFRARGWAALGQAAGPGWAGLVGAVRVSWGCLNTGPHTEWPRATLSVLEGRGPKSRGRQCHAH